jgi:hypothetical protein
MLLSIDIKPHKATVILGTGPANRYRTDQFAVFFYQFCDIKKGLFCPFLSIFMALTTNRYESKGEGEGEGESG